MNAPVATSDRSQVHVARAPAGRGRVAIVGAGIGGLTAGALLLHAGYPVTVLEAHVYPGGSAGTFYHQGYRFDAGATLAGGFAPGGPHARLAAILGIEWPVRAVDPAWVVHLPDGQTVTQWADLAAWEAEWRRAFPGSERFWRTQRRLADAAWEIAAQPLPWPPASASDVVTLAFALRPPTVRALPYLARTVAAMIPPGRPALKTFLDAQLLIAAQATSDETNALYGSAALDLPRRGANHVRGGIGALAETLVDWIRDHGGTVHFRQQVEEIEVRNGRAVAVHTNKGMAVEANLVLANVTPWSLHDLLGSEAPAALRREVDRRDPTWGAFTLYLGLDASFLRADAADHHQVIVDAERPLGEGNSVFISLSDAEDESRAPTGRRAATLSTHTDVTSWWGLRRGDDPAAYVARREEYTERLLRAAEQALPGIRDAADLILPGTPVTFQLFTRRPRGMVGGFPQTSLFRVRGPHTGIPNVKLVGDSIFPGQSTAGVTLGAMRVAKDVITQMNGKPTWIASTD